MAAVGKSTRGGGGSTFARTWECLLNGRAQAAGKECKGGGLLRRRQHDGVASVAADAPVVQRPSCLVVTSNVGRRSVRGDYDGHRLRCGLRTRQVNSRGSSVDSLQQSLCSESEGRVGDGLARMRSLAD